MGLFGTVTGTAEAFLSAAGNTVAVVTQLLRGRYVVVTEGGNVTIVGVWQKNKCVRMNPNRLGIEWRY